MEHRIGVEMKRAVVTLLLVGGVLTLLLAPLRPAPHVLAQGGDRVGLVVKFSDGDVFTSCIDYSGPGMTGEDVLDASGLPTVKQIYPGLGAAICKIGSDGCDYPNPDSCFCECEGATCEYWAYFHLDQQAGEWIYSGMGASWNTVEAGDVEGWAWGNGEVGGSDVAPPLMTFEELCAPPAPPTVDLYAEPEHIIAGQCSTVHWSVENAGVVTLDGEGVQPKDARYVCPQQTETFELRVLNDSGEYAYDVTITVTQPSPTPRATATATKAPTATRQLTAAPPPTATWIPQAPAVSPSPSPTEVPSATPTSRPTLVAMAATPTRTPAEEEPAVSQQGSGSSEHPLATPTPSTMREEPVGLQRILLLLAVGAGTLGFGAIAFVIMLVLLVVIYFRVRTHF
jgi:hypothetical protein